MNGQKLRITKRLQEIQRLLGAVPSQSKLTLWTLNKEHRTIFYGNLIKVDHKLNLVFIQLGADHPHLESSQECYVKFRDSEGVSKSVVSVVQDKTLILEISEELIVAEKRLHRRIQFHSEDQKNITLNLGSQNFEVSVLNASRNGMRVKIAQPQLNEMKNLGAFEITKLGSEGVSLKCHHVWSKEDSASIYIETELSEDQFNRFAQVPRASSVEPEKFFSDQEYFQTVRSNMDSIIAKLEKRPKLASAMKTLQINRDGNYIKTHIDLLCYVSCSVGRSLGWVTDSTIDKLIYVAYLHDIRYFETPHLAKIPSLAAFNEKKSTLSEEEQKAFLDGPSYSAIMAKDDEPGSLDVERILIQQKERPDGTGFPSGITFKQLFPLSCLFIICHEFVDYVYSRPNWNFKEFVTEARPVFKGPYFIKILQAFEELEQTRNKY